MASSKEYLDFILDQLTGLEGISYRAKGMLLVDDFENKELLAELFEKMYEELPMPKIKKKK